MLQPCLDSRLRLPRWIGELYHAFSAARGASFRLRGRSWRLILERQEVEKRRQQSREGAPLVLWEESVDGLLHQWDCL